MPLSDTTIRTAKPKDKLYRLTDANGLCLEVTPTGSKLWRYRYRFNGSAKNTTASGNPIPICIGHRRWGGIIISASIYAEDKA